MKRPFVFTQKSGFPPFRVVISDNYGRGNQMFKSKPPVAAERYMKVSLVWSSPNPERTIAVAMRRCYSTKVIEDIEAELEQKGVEYWKYLLTKCLQDKSLDVLEHFTMTLLVEDAGGREVGGLVMTFPYLRFTHLKDSDWLLSLNARTLVELWRDTGARSFAESIVSELDQRKISPVFNSLAFGERVNAS